MNDFSFIYFDEFDTKHIVSFKLQEYNNLMELLFDRFAEDIGDCKGRAWCGTCHIKILTKKTAALKNKEELKTLATISDADITSRLACQILIDQHLNNMVFKIVPE